MLPSKSGAGASISSARFGRRLGLRDRGHERDAVHRAPGPCPGDGDERRREVDVGDLPPHGPVGRHAGAAQDERHAERLLVGQELVARDAVLALQPAVVGHEDDQRVAQLAGGGEDLHQALHVVVDGEQRADPPLVVELELLDLVGGQRGRVGAHVRRLVGEVGLVEARRPRQGEARAPVRVARRRARVAPRPAHERRRDVLAVRRGGRPPDEERLLRVPLRRDEILGDLAGHVRRVVPGVLRSPVAIGGGAHGRGQLRQDPGETARVRRHLDVRELDELAREVRVAPRLEPAVAVHHEVVVVVGGHVEEPAPRVEADRDLAVGVERAVAVEPLADQRGAVAGPLQPPRQDVVPVLHAVPAVGVEVAHDTVVVGVLAGDEGRPRRAAQREGVDRVGERRPPRGEQAPDVRHLRDVGRRLIVGHDDEDVRPAVAGRDGGAGGGRAGERRGQERRGERRERDGGPAPHDGDTGPERTRWHARPLQVRSVARRRLISARAPA